MSAKSVNLVSAEDVLVKIVLAKDAVVAIRISKNSKIKRGLSVGYTPKFHKEPTEDAVIPFIQKDGEVKYVTPKDYKWMVDNNFIDGLKSKGQS